MAKSIKKMTEKQADDLLRYFVDSTKNEGILDSMRKIGLEVDFNDAREKLIAGEPVYAILKNKKAKGEEIKAPLVSYPKSVSVEFSVEDGKPAMSISKPFSDEELEKDRFNMIDARRVSSEAQKKLDIMVGRMEVTKKGKGGSVNPNEDLVSNFLAAMKKANVNLPDFETVSLPERNRWASIVDALVEFSDKTMTSLKIREPRVDAQGYTHNPRAVVLMENKGVEGAVSYDLPVKLSIDADAKNGRLYVGNYLAEEKRLVQVPFIHKGEVYSGSYILLPDEVMNQMKEGGIVQHSYVNDRGYDDMAIVWNDDKTGLPKATKFDIVMHECCPDLFDMLEKDGSLKLSASKKTVMFIDKKIPAKDARAIALGAVVDVDGKPVRINVRRERDLEKGGYKSVYEIVNCDREGRIVKSEDNRQTQQNSQSQSYSMNL